MRSWQLALVAWAALCVAAAQDTKKGGRVQALPTPAPAVAPPDSGRECSCRGVIRRSLDCSNLERSSWSSSELCTGRTHKVDLSQNNFVAFPNTWGAYVVRVNVSHNRLTQLPRVPPLNGDTEWLDLSENQISHATDELRALGSLEKLWVGGNRLRTLSFLPSPCALSVFSAPRNQLTTLEGLSRCTQLEVLDLSNNQVLSLPRLALDELVKLEKLNLHGAGLVSIEEGAFDDLVELELLDLSDNDLTSLPTGLFRTLRELDNLFLEDNSLTTLPAEAFAGLSELEKLNLTNNKLTSLSTGAFNGLIDMKYLILKHNRLTTLPNNIFSGLQEVKGIDVSNNQLEALPPNLFHGLATLQKVNFKHNRLSALPADLFTGVTTLEVVDFSNNQLSALPSGLFRELTSIKTLDLSSNRFTSFSGRDLSGLQTLERLNLEFNLLTVLPLYDSTWPPVERAIFDSNNIVNAGEVTMRSWLGDGGHTRVVSMQGRPPLASPGALRWVLDDGSLTTSTSDTMGCACGGIKKGDAEVRFCVATACPNMHTNWVEAVRAAPAPAQQQSVKG